MTSVDMSISHTPLSRRRAINRMFQIGSGIFGKWHLGYKDPHLPQNQSYVFPEKTDLSMPYSDDVKAFITNNPHKGIDRNFQQGVRFIEQNKDKPFLCILSYSMVHTKPSARKELVLKYRTKLAGKEDLIHPEYAAMCETVDESVGLVSRILDDLGLTENTFLIFYSDNGGVINEKGYLGSSGTLTPSGFEFNVTTTYPLKWSLGS